MVDIKTGKDIKTIISATTPTIEKDKFDPRTLKIEIKQIIEDNIKIGNLDSNLIKNDVFNFLKQKINTDILTKVIPKEPKSIMGFVGNFAEDTKELIDGIGSLLGIGVKAALNPIDSIKNVGGFTAKMITSPQYRQQINTTFVKPIIEEYKEYKHPLQKAYEDPLMVLLDATVIASLAGKGLSVAGGTAKIATARSSSTANAISTARKAQKIAKTSEELAAATKALKVAQTVEKTEPLTRIFRTAEGIEKFGEGLTGASTIFSLKNLSEGTKKIIRQLPEGEAMVRTMELSSKTRKFLSNEQVNFLNIRNNILKQIDDTVKNLSKEEVSILPKVIEGFSQTPANASPEFYKAVGMVKSLADDQARFGIKAGKLTPEIIERRNFQPLANWLEKESKFAPSEIVSAKNKLRSANTVEQVTKAEKQLTAARKEYGFENLTGQELQGYITTIKNYFPDADPIYMRHFFDNPKHTTKFMLETKPVREFTPGFLKKSYGKDGYIGSTTDVTAKQLKTILGKQATENLNWQKNMQLIDTIKNMPETKILKKGDDLLPGHSVFAPDGFLKFYKGTIDLTDDLGKKIKGLSDDTDIWETFQKSVQSTFPKFEKKFTGVTDTKIYQVPTAVANQLQKSVTSTNPYIKLIWDKPIDAFRFAALGLFPRWQFNNIIGNTVFSIVDGSIFNPKAFYIQNQARKQPGLMPDNLFGGIHQTERTTSGKLGSAVDLPVVRSTIAMHDNVLNTKFIGGLVKNIEKTVNMAVVKPIVTIGNASFKLNGYVDDAFKGAAFVNKVLKNDRKNFLTRMTTSLDDSLKILEGTTKNKKLTQKIVDDVQDWYYYGLNLTDFERRFIRRTVPFYSWMRWATLYSYKITTEAPVRANIIANMSRDFYTFTGQNNLPDHLKGSVPIGTDEDGTVHYLKTKGLNPFSHINDLMAGEGLIGSVLTTALQSSAPPIKTAAELSLGKDIFLDRPFTREDVQRMMNGDLYKFDPELGDLKKIEGKIRPNAIESLLRNYIPQYLLMETVLTGGQKRYTAEGLNTILSDLFKNPEDRKSIVKDVLSRQGEEEPKWGYEFLKTLGINIKEITPESRRFDQEMKERATNALKNKMLPILDDNFKKKVKVKLMEEIAKGTPKKEIETKLKGWIQEAVLDIGKLMEDKEE